MRLPKERGLAAWQRGHMKMCIRRKDLAHSVDAMQSLISRICHGSLLFLCDRGLAVFLEKVVECFFNEGLAVLIPLGGEDLELGERGL